MRLIGAAREKMNKELETIYCIFLGEALGYGSSKIKRILEFFKSGNYFYKSGFESWKKCDFFNENDLLKLKAGKLKNAENIYSVCRNENYDVIPYTSERYPQILKSIANPPAVLYVSGNLPKLDDKISIAIVGTRNSTVYGKNVAFNLGYNLADSGVIVVSGGALGIDSAAQHGGIMAGGKVISVLGCGFKSKYLISNEKLRESTKKNGALISEYPPNTPAIPRNFPIRNRIISGISSGVLVVEAGEKSGSLITARIAKKQEKKIFAVPGNINSFYSIGTNNLIKNGAKLITNVKDILEELPHTSNSFEKKKDFKINYKYNLEDDIKLATQEKVPEYTLVKKVRPRTEYKGRAQKEDSTFREKKLDFSLGIKDLSNVSKDGLKVYNSLSSSKSIPLDVIVFRAKLDVSTVLKCLTELEILDLTKSLPGGRYIKN